MELLYYYCPRIGNIESGDWIKLGTSFSLEIENDIHYFRKKSFRWPLAKNIISTNVILGKNGAGKTTALQSVFNALTYKKELPAGAALIIEKLGIVYVFSGANFNKIIDVEGGFTPIETKNSILTEVDLTPIYIDTMLKIDSINWRPSTYSIDASSNSLIASDSRNVGSDQIIYDFSKHVSSDLERELDFLKSKKVAAFRKYTDVNYPNELTVRVLEDSLKMITENLTEKKHKRIKSALSKFEDFSYAFESSFRNALGLAVGASFLAVNLVKNLSSVIEVLESLESVPSADEKVNEFLNAIKFNKKIGPVFEKKFDAYHAISMLLKKAPYVSQGLTDIEIDLNHQKATVFVNNLLGLYDVNSPIRFEWRNMSSGEHSMLRLFSRVYYAFLLARKKNQSTNILLLIDEPDTCLHPNWEKELLKDLLFAIGEIFDGFNVQLVFTTNKPFVLSDLTADNLTLLGDKYHRADNFDPFCSRIPSILKKDFFLDDDLGAIAREFLEKIEKSPLTLSDNEKEAIKKIGDKFLQSSILRYIERETASSQ